MTNEIEETAKAVQDVAQAARKGLEISEKVGGFISRFAGESLETAFGIFADRLKYLRWERQVRLISRADKFLRDQGLPQPSRRVPLKLLIPLLQGASLEEDDDLQDLWAKLLTNAAIDGEVDVTRNFVDILERLSSFEAQVLNLIYSIPYDEMHHNGVDTSNLPRTAKPFPNKKDPQPVEPGSEEVRLALANLDRLGCLAVARSMGGGQLFGQVNPTLFGKRFIDACTLRSNKVRIEMSRSA